MNTTIIDLDERLVADAQMGNTAALDELIRRNQSRVFNLALRMVWRREEAEAATQEILVQAVSQLGTFTGHSSFRTWLYRIAVNHLLGVHKSEMEEKGMTFTDLGVTLDGVGDEDLPDGQSLPVDPGALVEEAKLGCLTAMLMCLSRGRRLAFILGEVFGEKSEVAAAEMGITSADFRMLLAHARRDLYHFMNGKCGLVNQANPCRCALKAAGFKRNGWLNEDNLQFSRDRVAAVRDLAADRLNELHAIDRRHAELYRTQPFLAGPDLVAKLHESLSSPSPVTN